MKGIANALLGSGIAEIVLGYIHLSRSDYHFTQASILIVGGLIIHAIEKKK